VSDKIDELVALIKALRGDGGCPWDQQQTPGTLAPYLIEEAHELLDAIGRGQHEQIREELGDVLFQALFICVLYQEQNAFGLDDALAESLEKMTRRHPHVFGESHVDTPEDVKKQWHELKRREKLDRGQESILDSIPGSLPALMRAYRISDRAGGAGFDWESISDVFDTVEEEWDEFRTALASGSGESGNHQAEMEFGDILFTLVNVARFARIHPETALTESIGKFEKRFRHMESTLSDEGKSLESVSYAELQRRWEKAKKETDPL